MTEQTNEVVAWLWDEVLTEGTATCADTDEPEKCKYVSNVEPLVRQSALLASEARVRELEAKLEEAEGGGL